ncbi:polycystic kidney disease 2-like 1 [Brachionus plicatilis]|uniref:Polycystic kidney disease 2-like 1 n=1 Tax=Brachionus plicatilis TaxID=10195 RepID=A0A3M7RSW4_BRAPC|nr:polycystic kidney disease 2-like 1 [Brachionus plicatilis]
MRFLQLNKFSYLVRKLNGVERLPPGEDIFKNSKLYDKFLKSTLIETLITISFVFACIKFLILYNNLVDGTQFNYSSDTKLPFANLFVDEILIKIYEELLKTTQIFVTNPRRFLTTAGKAFNIVNQKKPGKDEYLIVIKYMIEFGEKSSSLAESILDEKCKNTITVKEESSLMFYLDFMKFSLDKLCFQSLRNKTQKVMVKLIGLEKKEYVKIFELESNFIVKKFIQKSYDLNVARKINDFEFLIYLVVFCIFFVFYVIEELIEMVKYKASYVSNYVNLVDLMIILLSARLLGFIFYKTSFQLNAIKTFKKYEQKPKIDINFKFKFHAIIEKIEFYNDFLNPDTEINLAILQVILIWIKIFKYVNFSTGLTQMNAALTKSANHLISYLFIYSIVFCTHAEMMHRLFGPYEADFSHRIMAQFTMFRMLLANINFKFIATNPGTQLIFFSFYMTIFIIFSVLDSMLSPTALDTFLVSKLNGKFLDKIVKKF